MRLDVEDVLERANEIYATRKVLPSSLAYVAPERRPRIQSEQVKAAVEAIVEAINQQSVVVVTSPPEKTT
jgi:hypothetical protein